MSDQLLLLYGDESYLIDDALAKIKSKNVDPSFETFSYQLIDGERSSTDEMINAIQTLPSFSPTRLVQINNPFFLINKRGKASSDASGSSLMVENEELLLNNLKEIPLGVTVVLAVYGSVDMRKKIPQFLKKSAKIQEYKPFASWEIDKLNNWVSDNISQKGYQISSDAANLLIMTAGSLLQVLNNEIEKVVTYVADKKNIEIDDIKAVVSQGELAAFELQDNLNARNIAGALVVINRMVKDGGSPIMILGSLVAQFRLMLQIKELGGGNPYDIAKQLKKNAFYIKKIAAGAAKYKLAELKNLYLSLHDADIKMKTGQMEPKLALEYALSSII